MTLPLVVALLSGSLLAAVVALFRFRADRHKIHAETLAEYQDLVAELRQEANALREAEHKARQEASRIEALLAEAQTERHRCAEELATLTARVAAMERLVPSLLFAANLQDLGEELLTVLDEMPVPAILSVPDEEARGRLVFVNAKFCAALGRTQAEILRLGWAALCHPEDLERTYAVEGAAAFRPVRARNRFLHADGHWVALRWTSTRYMRPRGLTSGEGIAFAWVAVLADFREEAR